MALPNLALNSGFKEETFGELDIVLDVAAQFRGTEGRYAERFENDLANWFKMSAGVVASSETGAVSVLIGALGWVPDDEIILAPTAAPWMLFALIHAGLRPVFVDLDTDTLSLASEQLRAAITTRTRAIIETPVWGYAIDLKDTASLAAEVGLPLIVDVTQGLGTSFNGQNLLSNADIGVMSLSGRARTVSVGEGGALLFRDRDLAMRARSYARFSDLDGIHLGINQKLSEPQAALGTHRLAHLADHLHAQQSAADRLERRLGSDGAILLPQRIGAYRNGAFVITWRSENSAHPEIPTVMLALSTALKVAAPFLSACPSALRWRNELRAVPVVITEGL